MLLFFYKTLILLFSFSLLYALTTEELKSKLHLSEIGTENNSGIIELYNSSDIDIDLKQETIRIEVKKNTSSSQNPNIFCLLKESDGTVKSDFVIKAHSFFLIVSSNASSYTNIADFIITNKTSNRGFFDGNDTLFLANGSVSSLEDSDIIEFVGLGNNIFQGSSSAQSITGQQTIEKKANLLSTKTSMQRGGADFNSGNSFKSGNNGDDWLLQNKSDFQNKNSPSEKSSQGINDFFIKGLESKKLGIKINHPHYKIIALEFEINHTNQNNFLKEILVNLEIKNSSKDFIEKVELTNHLKQKINLNFISNSVDQNYYLYQNSQNYFSVSQTTNFVILHLKSIEKSDIEIRSELLPKWVKDNNDFFAKGLKVNGNSIFSVEKILFSEIKTEGSHSEDEYIELYNSTSKDISLEDWSIHYQSSTGSWKKLFTFDKKNITNKSYFLIGGRQYGEVPHADVTHTLKLSSSANGFSLALKNESDITVDEVSFGNSLNLLKDKFLQVPNQNQSLERKASINSTSITMTNNHFYFGNSFDSLKSKDDFVLSSPNPQNRFSLSEPVENPKISSIDSTEKYYGEKITIEGENFLLFDSKNSILNLGDEKIINITLWNNQKIIFYLPNSFKDNQKLKVKVKNVEDNFVEKDFSTPIKVKPIQITELELKNIQAAHSLKINIEGLQYLLKNEFNTLENDYLEFKLDDFILNDKPFFYYKDNHLTLLLPTESQFYKDKKKSILTIKDKQLNNTKQIDVFYENIPKATVRTNWISINKKNIGINESIQINYNPYHQDSSLREKNYPQIFFYDLQNTKITIPFKINSVDDLSPSLSVKSLNHSKNKITQNLNSLAKHLYTVNLKTDIFKNWQSDKVYFSILEKYKNQADIVSNFHPLFLKLDNQIPYKVNSFFLSHKNNNSATFRWTANSEYIQQEKDLSHYRLELFEYQNTFHFKKIILITNLNQNQYSFYNLIPNQKYKVNLFTVDQNNNYGEISTIEWLTQKYDDKKINLIEPFVKNGAIQVYNCKANSKIEIFDHKGFLWQSKILSRDEKFCEIKISTKLKSRTFFVKVTHNNQKKLQWVAR